MSRNRAQRRHNTAKYKAKAVRRENAVHLDARRALSSRDIGILANNATLCSCPMCGNPRKHFGNASQTLQEIRANDSFADALSVL
ncbi:MAG: hypothetical protein OSB62_04110 [Alphaproteobacteria bacterium]|jgi:hypothetical protein|nr:hypothetical protein [Alphaproteobacteria bacterium]